MARKTTAGAATSGEPASPAGPDEAAGKARQAMAKAHAQAQAAVATAHRQAQQAVVDAVEATRRAIGS